MLSSSPTRNLGESIQPKKSQSENEEESGERGEGRGERMGNYQRKKKKDLPKRLPLESLVTYLSCDFESEIAYSVHLHRYPVYTHNLSWLLGCTQRLLYTLVYTLQQDLLLPSHVDLLSPLPISLMRGEGGEEREEAVPLFAPLSQRELTAHIFLRNGLKPPQDIGLCADDLEISRREKVLSFSPGMKSKKQKGRQIRVLGRGVEDGGESREGNGEGRGKRGERHVSPIDISLLALAGTPVTR